MTPPRQPPSKRQRGAALLTAMIIVALVATLAAAMVWQQWRAVQVEAAERARAQSAWILTGARDFAGLILKEDFKGGGRNKTALTEPWALPLKESRLSTFLAVDNTNADDGPEAFLSGDITDAQAKFNLRDLVRADGKPEPEALAVLQRLCSTVSLDAGVADRIANGLIAAIGPAGAGGAAAAPLEPKRIAQLVWLGIDPNAVAALEPFVVLLPVATPVNVNTASKEVLAAIADIPDATFLVQLRQRAPFTTIESFKRQAGIVAGTPNIAVRSNYFEVRGSLRLTDHVLTERSLVVRDQQFGNVTPLQRERIASLTQAGG